MNLVYLLLGSNLGNRINHIEQAIWMLTDTIGTMKAASSLYETEPWGREEQPLFCNSVVCMQTYLSPEVLLSRLQAIEKKLGKVIQEKWGPRSIDIDILYYNDYIRDTLHLKIPHKELPQRKFALIPLCEIAPHFIHPVYQQTNSVLLRNCLDLHKVWIL